MLSPEEGAIGILKRLKPLLYLVIGGPYIGMMLSGAIGMLTNTLWLSTVFNSLTFLLHLEIAVLIGIIVGLMLAAAYVHRGVSAYVIMGSLLMLLPTILIPSDSAEFAISLVLNGLDGVIISILVLDICSTCLFERTSGEEKASDDAQASIIRTIAYAYITDVLRTLERRVEVDNDEIARQTVSEIMHSDSVASQIVADAATSPEKGNGLGQDVTKRNPSRGIDSGIQHEQTALLTKIRSRLKISGTWTLTNSEFRRRVRMNMGLFLPSLAIISVLGFAALSNLSIQTNQWIFLLSAGLIITSFPLAFFDNSFMQRRLSSEMVMRDAMAPLLGLEKMMLTDQITGLIASSDPQIEAQYFEVYEPDLATDKVELITTQHLNRAHERFKAFLKRVVEGKGQVYEENAQAPYIIAVGVLTSFPIGIILLMAGSNFLPGYHDALIIVMILGLLILFGGILWWLRLMKSSSFHGIERGFLSTALSYLEAKEASIESMGTIVYPTPPSQFEFLKLAGPNAVKTTLAALNKDVLIQQDHTIAVKALKAEGKVSWLDLCLVPVLLLVTVFPIVLIAIFGMTELLIIWLIATVIIFVSLIAPYRHYDRKRRRVEHRIPERSRDKPIEQFSQILTLLRTEYDYPLRLLVVRNHQELLYTGRTFITSTGVKMQEAVFLPGKAS